MIDMNMIFGIGIFVGGYLLRAIAERMYQRRKEELKKAELRGVEKERERQEKVLRNRCAFETSRNFGINREGRFFL